MTARFVAFLAVALFSACGHTCRWESQGACIAVDEGWAVDRMAWTDAQWQEVLDETIRRSVAYWDSGSIENWTVILHDHDPSCYLVSARGCVVLGIREIHVRTYDWCPLAILPHEIGHAVTMGGDPTHWAGGWATIEYERRTAHHTIAQCEPQ